MMYAIAAFVVLAGTSEEYTRPLPKNAIGPAPHRTHVDLGPIVLPSKLKGQDKLAQYLQREADRLGANGFFLVNPARPTSNAPQPDQVSPFVRPEEHPNRVAHPERTYSASEIGGLQGALVLGAVVGFLAIVQHGAKARVDNGVLHAFTFRTLPKETRDGLDLASAEALAGRITTAEFEMRRTELLAAARD